jgi:hypothetical protein
MDEWAPFTRLRVRAWTSILLTAFTRNGVALPHPDGVRNDDWTEKKTIAPAGKPLKLKNRRSGQLDFTKRAAGARKRARGAHKPLPGVVTFYCGIRLNRDDTKQNFLRSTRDVSGFFYAVNIRSLVEPNIFDFVRQVFSG